MNLRCVRRAFWLTVSMNFLVVIGGDARAADSVFVRGDANADGATNVGDAVYMLFCSFGGLDCSGACADAADVDDNGTNDVTDAVVLLGFLFTEGPAPSAPHDACGADPTEDSLGCASFSPCSDPDAIPTASGPLLVKPINHATLVLLWDGKAIYIDPVGGASSFNGLPPPDLILVTDIHGDHMEAATLKAIVRPTTSLVIPKAVSDSLAGAVKAGETVVLANAETKTVQGIEITGVPMYNLTAGRLNYHTKGRGNGYVLDLAGTRVYASGDTEDIPEMRALESIDVAFLCMNLPFTMTAQQAASATIEFQPRIVYPYHSRGQDTNLFKSLCGEGAPSVEVRLRNWYE